MKKLYSLIVRSYNGTVTASEEVTNYEDFDLAEKVRLAVEEANKDNHNVSTFIKETYMYESENEVPILNNKEKDNEEI